MIIDQNDQLLTSWLAVREKNDHCMDDEDVHDCRLARRPLKADLILRLGLHTATISLNTCSLIQVPYILAYKLSRV